MQSNLKRKLSNCDAQYFEKTKQVTKCPNKSEVSTQRTSSHLTLFDDSNKLTNTNVLNSESNDETDEMVDVVSFTEAEIDITLKLNRNTDKTSDTFNTNIKNDSLDSEPYLDHKSKNQFECKSIKQETISTKRPIYGSQQYHENDENKETSDLPSKRSCNSHLESIVSKLKNTKKCTAFDIFTEEKKNHFTASSLRKSDDLETNTPLQKQQSNSSLESLIESDQVATHGTWMPPMDTMYRRDDNLYMLSGKPNKANVDYKDTKSCYSQENIFQKCPQDKHNEISKNKQAACKISNIKTRPLCIITSKNENSIRSTRWREFPKYKESESRTRPKSKYTKFIDGNSISPHQENKER